MEIYNTNSEVEKILHEYITHPNWEEVLEVGKESKYSCELPEETLNIEEFLAKKIEKLLGKTLIDYGGSRVLFQEGNYAIKIPLETFGSVENDTDIVNWRDMPEVGKQYFVPVLGGNSNIVIYPFVEVFTYESFMDYEEEANRIIESLIKIGIHADDCEEGRWDQWGLYKGKLVIIDSGRCYMLNDKISAK